MKIKKTENKDRRSISANSHIQRSLKNLFPHMLSWRSLLNPYADSMTRDAQVIRSKRARGGEGVGSLRKSKHRNTLKTFYSRSVIWNGHSSQAHRNENKKKSTYLAVPFLQLFHATPFDDFHAHDIHDSSSPTQLCGCAQYW